ncbi:hypothetical protein C8Q80DRAFT_1269031 [Daedaleopsis nitida]|nr:hypothetical protein C8Q80DRAFT_1269031 [Daedaleopsis nitida]
MSQPALSLSNHQNHSSGSVQIQTSGVEGSRVSNHATRRAKKFPLEPCEKLHPSFYTDRKAPLMFYGWAWNRAYLFDYAIRHRLSYHLGDLELKYSLLAEPGFSKDDFRHYNLLRLQAPEVVRKHISARCGIPLHREFPVQRREHDGVFALYSNGNAVIQVKVLLRPGVAQFEKSLGIIHTAMNEKGYKSDLLWWHCRNKFE